MPIFRRSGAVWVLVAAAALAAPSVRAQPSELLRGIVTITEQDIGVGPGETGRHVGGKLLFPIARYHPGDSPGWADPGYDDSDWEIASIGLRSDVMPRQGWPGIGWFRVTLRLDESLRGHDLGFAFAHSGALEAYLDGRLVYRTGTVGRSEETERPEVKNDPVPLPVEAGNEYVLALRYSSFVTMGFRSSWSYTGPGVYWGDRERMVLHRGFARFYQGAFTAFFLAFALLFGLLYALYRQEKLFLFLAVSQGLSVPYVFIGSQIPFMNDPALAMPMADVTFAFAVAALLAELLVVYAFFYRAPPRPFYGLALIGVLSSIAVAYRLDLVIGFLVFFALLGLEMLRVVVAALWKRRRWAWIVAVGIAPGVLIQFWIVAADFGLIGAPWTGTPFNPSVLSMLIFSIAFSVYVGVRFAEAHRGLVELDAARHLQLSMLPDSVPEHPTVTLAAGMQTATEVGGDYYDFDLSDDGTLTVAIGDATGHGTRAGVLVTATKSLWSAFSGVRDLEEVLELSSEAIRRMRLPSLYMALALGRLRGRRLELVGAGLPPALVWRAADGSVDEVPLKGVPLGGPKGGHYRTHYLDLEAGDAVLLMTDGFPERFRADGEMLGYERVAGEFAAVAALSPAEAVERLMARGDAWAGGRGPDDDVTFVLMKVKSDPA